MVNTGCFFQGEDERRIVIVQDREWTVQHWHGCEFKVSNEPLPSLPRKCGCASDRQAGREESQHHDVLWQCAQGPSNGYSHGCGETWFGMDEKQSCTMVAPNLRNHRQWKPTFTEADYCQWTTRSDLSVAFMCLSDLSEALVRGF